MQRLMWRSGVSGRDSRLLKSRQRFVKQPKRNAAIGRLPIIKTESKSTCAYIIGFNQLLMMCEEIWFLYNSATGIKSFRSCSFYRTKLVDATSLGPTTHYGTTVSVSVFFISYRLTSEVVVTADCSISCRDGNDEGVPLDTKVLYSHAHMIVILENSGP
jgi:hypothetical protein